MSKKKQRIRVRFAPSPTGFVHVGSLLTALFDYLFARQNKGDFILRIEDTDRERLVEGAVENLIKTLKWAGLDYDEGPDIGSKYGPYVQSERLDIYKKYAEELVKKGQAYYCFCSEERLKKLRQSQVDNRIPPMYDKHCLNLKSEEIKEKLNKGEPYVIRLNVPNEGVTKFRDVIRGEVEVNNKTIDDQILLKSDGFPTYHLAVVVDDHLMEISHIIRAQEWLPSTPKHILLYQAFGWQPPEFVHMSHLLNKDRSKLSKRQGDVAVEDYIKKGYLPEALLNFLAITGWNEGEGCEQEIYSMAELIKKFKLERIHKSGAIFDIDKLDWINGVYIRKMKVKDLAKLCLPYLKDMGYGIWDMGYVEKVVALEQERMKKLSDIVELTKYFFIDKLEYQPEMLVWKKSDKNTIKNNLEKLLEFLSGIKKWDKNNLEKEIIKWVGEQGLTNGEVLWPMRVALTGEEKSPGPFEVADVLGKEKSLKRIKEAMVKI